MRAGVSDFVDPSVAPQEVKDVVQRLLDTPVAGGGRAGQRRSVLLLGTRRAWAQARWPCLAGLVQDRMKQAHALRAGASGAKPSKSAEAGAMQPLSSRVALLDLGWPVGDCQLYLNIGSDFDFAEARATCAAWIRPCWARRWRTRPTV